MTLRTKRIYASAAKADGYRVLVDRIWPRGIKKADAAIDLWLKDIAPSTSLRKWFNHDAEKWGDFRKKYKEEIKDSFALEELKTILKSHKVITLLYSAKDEEHNQAIALQQMLT